MRIMLPVIASLIFVGCQSMPDSHIKPEDKMIAGVADIDLSEEELYETQQAAETGDFEACYRLHMYYEMVVGDFRKANQFLRKGAEGGHAKSQYSLGVGLIDDPETYEEGIFWLKKARDSGDQEANEVLKIYEKKGDAKSKKSETDHD